MSQENVDAVTRAIDAINERAIDRYLACCTEDIELRSPQSDVQGAPYVGEPGIRRWFADIADAAPDFRLEVERVREMDESRVLAYVQMRASGRTTGIPFDTQITNVYDLADGMIRRVQVYLDRAEALEAVGLTE